MALLARRSTKLATRVVAELEQHLLGPGEGVPTLKEYLERYETCTIEVAERGCVVGGKQVGGTELASALRNGGVSTLHIDAPIEAVLPSLVVAWADPGEADRDLGVRLVEAQLSGLSVGLRDLEQAKLVQATAWQGEVLPRDVELGRQWREALLATAEGEGLLRLWTEADEAGRTALVEGTADQVHGEVHAGAIASAHERMRVVLALGDDLAVAFRKALQSRLSARETLPVLYSALDDVEDQKAAAALLQLVEDIDVRSMVAQLGRLKREDARIALAEILKERTIEPDMLVNYARPEHPDTFAPLAWVAARQADRSAWERIAALGLGHGDPAIRLRTLRAMPRALARKEGERAAALLADSNADVRRKARELVLRRGDPDLAPFLAKALKASGMEHEERITVVAALAAAGGEQATDALVSEFSHPDAEVKLACVRGLGTVGDERAEEFLETQANHKLRRFSIRKACDDALTRLRAQRASKASAADIQEAVQRLVRATAESSDELVAAANALSDLGPGAVAEGAIQLDLMLDEADTDRRRRYCVVALALVGGPAAGETLRRHFQFSTDDAERQLTAWALGRVGDDDCIDFLRNQASRWNLSEPVRISCARAADIADRQQQLAANAWDEEFVRQALLAMEGNTDALQARLAEVARILRSRARTVLFQSAGDLAGLAGESLRVALGLAADPLQAGLGAATAAGEALDEAMTAEEKADWEERRKRKEEQRQRRLLTLKLEYLKQRGKDDEAAGELRERLINEGVAVDELERVGLNEDESREAAEMQKATEAATRTLNIPDLGSMFRNYIYFENGQAHTFGCRYGSQMLVDVHTYEAPTESQAYQRFFMDKISEGFVPQTNKRMELDGVDRWWPLDLRLMAKAFTKAADV